MTTWPDLATLELLVALADEGSLSAAARRCGVAQPNASRSIARLERGLGLSLIHRATTGARVTTDGLLVVEWARATLEAARALETGVAALRARTQAPLVVMASQTVAEHLLPGWIAGWQHAAGGAGAGGASPHDPSLGETRGISVAVGNTTEVLAAARGGEVDLGFIEGPGAPPGLNSVVVAHDDLVLVVAPQHPWAARSRVRAEELAATPLVARESGSGTRVALRRALAPLDVAPPALELASNAAVRVSAAAGTAPAVLSRLAVDDALRAGTLVEVGVDGVDLTRNLRAVWAGPRRLTNPAAAALLATAAG
ncbi:MULTISPECIES: LysR family transcriptional regulator [Dermacoccus]|uniref:LysR family transcriptional regulator n=1 Tax=Dermacoccus TaxID=57495 RepID=UPI0009398E50|nr:MULTISPECIES: LysR family transcriptional regulator [Dermacoccus]MBO1757566.1 LysR family transcriptional regulator [Dermacoccus sp. NHGro5]MCT1603583.1 LysR family transcriptional regulator [Dermacoccus nishinomiyaensis]TCJ91996.1 DNA-binding transcriptional LysR family regulator [Dermacoccus sp. SAI-028]